MIFSVTLAVRVLVVRVPVVRVANAVAAVAATAIVEPATKTTQIGHMVSFQQTATTASTIADQ